jgi:hypothetical protein
VDTKHPDYQKRTAEQRAADRAARAARRSEGNKAPDVSVVRAIELATKQSPPAPVVETVGAEWSVPLSAPRGTKK